MEKNTIKISVILSFLDEQEVLPELIKRLRNVFSNLKKKQIVSSYELIFVNDNSSDGSEKLLTSETKKGDVILLNMSRNFGVSECAIAGMSISNGDAVIYMDADLQDPPELIESLIDAWIKDKDAEVVHTTRTKRKGEHWLKMIVTKIGYRFINFISEIDLPIDSGDFKLLSRKVVNHVLELNETRPYLRGLISWIGYKQIHISYNRDERLNGRLNTKMNVLSSKVIYYWLDRALISFSDAPLKIILFFGLMLSGFSLFYIIVILIQKLLGISIPGWAAIMSSVLFLGGVQIIMLGAMGLYVGANYRESKKRPLYIIKNIIRKK